MLLAWGWDREGGGGGGWADQLGYSICIVTHCDAHIVNGVDRWSTAPLCCTLLRMFLC